MAFDDDLDAALSGDEPVSDEDEFAFGFGTCGTNHGVDCSCTMAYASCAGCSGTVCDCGSPAAQCDDCGNWFCGFCVEQRFEQVGIAYVDVNEHRRFKFHCGCVGAVRVTTDPF